MPDNSAGIEIPKESRDALEKLRTDILNCFPGIPFADTFSRTLDNAFKIAYRNGRVDGMNIMIGKLERTR